MALVALDWNGTLIDDTDAWAQAYNAALGVFGIAPQPLEILQDRYDTPTRVSILSFGVTEADYERHSQKAYTAFMAVLRAEAPKAGLRKGARDLIASLQADGNEVWLLSNHHRDDLARELAQHGLSDVFSRISGRDSMEEIRTQSTKAGRLLAHMAQGGWTSAQTVIIGDAREEARIARDHGLLGIGITGGYSSAAHMVRDGAHHVVDTLEAIPAIIRRAIPALSC